MWTYNVLPPQRRSTNVRTQREKFGVHHGSRARFTMSKLMPLLLCATQNVFHLLFIHHIHVFNGCFLVYYTLVWSTCGSVYAYVAIYWREHTHKFATLSRSLFPIYEYRFWLDANILCWQKWIENDAHDDVAIRYLVNNRKLLLFVFRL